MQDNLERHPWVLLLLGAIATSLGHLRWGIDPIAWLAPIAWLRYLAVTAGWRSRVSFAVVFASTWTVTLLGIVTAPLTPMMAPMFGIPIAVLLGWPYLLWARARRGRGDSMWSTLLFPAAMAVAEALAYSITPFGVWGHAANAALDDLALMQLASLTGAVGIGFVLHWLAAAIESRLAGNGSRSLALAGAAFLAVHVYGGLRVDLASSVGEPTVLVAAVGTDNDVGGLPLPSPAQRESWDRALFERTRSAAQAGAELVVWTEASSVVEPADEPAWLASVGELAREQHVAIVAGYIVPLLDRDRFMYENAYVLFDPNGVLVHRYLKHHPVPGEPAVRGTEPTPMWSSELLGEVSGALCYDYDFPAMARARGTADLVALPSSDWRGIDPIHTHMARLRAIEGGHAVLRSTRFGLSAGIDSTGVIRGQLSHFDDDERILLVHLPRHGRTTLYARLGEWFALLCGLLAAVALVRLRSRS